MLSSLNNIIFSIPTQMVYFALILYVTAFLHTVSRFILYCTFYHELTLRLSIIYKINAVYCNWVSGERLLPV